ncbi:MAG: thiamine phosphate synthase [Rhodospirillales bacterium]|nr:thiamine phosphate synthase [Rhodospirillales bacterium]
MTDSLRLADPRPAVRALPRESAVIVRHYDDPERVELARALISICREKNNRVLIAGDARLALALGADGLHLPETMLSKGSRRWRPWRRPGMLLSAAAHSPKALVGATYLGVDFALLSPVFPTTSHPGANSIGPSRFAAWTLNAGLPVFALGGVNAHNKKRILFAGAAGWAGIEGLS